MLMNIIVVIWKSCADFTLLPIAHLDFFKMYLLFFFLPLYDTEKAIPARLMVQEAN